MQTRTHRATVGLVLVLSLGACNTFNTDPTTSTEATLRSETLGAQSLQLPALQRKLLEVNGGKFAAYQYAANNFAAITKLNSSVFDGTVIRSSNGTQLMTLTPMKTIYGTPDSFASDRAAMAAIKTKSTKFANSFLLLNVKAAAGWDWFNDAHWANVQSNLLEQVKVAKAGGLRGIAFDMEQYPETSKNIYTNETYSLLPWEYRKQAKASSKTFSQYQLQVRKRGQQFILALQNAWPGVTVFCYYLTSVSDGTYFDFPNINYASLQQYLIDDGEGLWGSFYNGWLDSIAPTTKLIDGNEHAYDYTVPAHWITARAGLTNKAPLYFIDPANRTKYARNVSFANGIYFDGTMNVYASAPNLDLSVARRYMGFFAKNDLERSNLLEQSVHNGLRFGDEFAWLDSETYNWFAPEPAIKNNDDRIAAARIVTARLALEAGKRKFRAGQPLGLNMAFVPRLSSDWANGIVPDRIIFPK
jgi:hypothetical protein